MGADISYAIEGQDHKGTWHTLFTSDLCYTAWFKAFARKESRYDDDRYGFSTLRRRCYVLFGLLSGVRTQHPFPDHVGGSEGIAQPYGDVFALPEDASPFARELLDDNGDNHSQGWIDGRDINALLTALRAITPTNTTETETITEGRAFLQGTKRLMRLLGGRQGTPGLLGTPMTHLPEEPNASLCPDMSAHATLTMVGILRSHEGLPVERMRILIAYDN